MTDIKYGGSLGPVQILLGVSCIALGPAIDQIVTQYQSGRIGVPGAVCYRDVQACVDDIVKR